MLKSNKLYIFIIGVLASIFLLYGCSPNAASASASTAVEEYLQALVAKDINKMTNLSCAAWEPQAKVEFDSFAAVKLNLKDLACKDVGKEGDASLVSCSGSIIASYGNEDLPIDIASQTYKVTQEGGEWRICGYQK